MGAIIQAPVITVKYDLSLSIFDHNCILKPMCFFRPKLVCRFTIWCHFEKVFISQIEFFGGTNSSQIILSKYKDLYILYIYYIYKLIYTLYKPSILNLTINTFLNRICFNTLTPVCTTVVQKSYLNYSIGINVLIREKEIFNIYYCYYHKEFDGLTISSKPVAYIIITAVNSSIGKLAILSHAHIDDKNYEEERSSFVKQMLNIIHS